MIGKLICIEITVGVSISIWTIRNNTRNDNYEESISIALSLRSLLDVTFLTNLFQKYSRSIFEFRQFI